MDNKKIQQRTNMLLPAARSLIVPGNMLVWYRSQAIQRTAPDTLIVIGKPEKLHV